MEGQDFIKLIQQNAGHSFNFSKIYVSEAGIVICCADGLRVGIDLPEYKDDGLKNVYQELNR